MYMYAYSYVQVHIHHDTYILAVMIWRRARWRQYMCANTCINTHAHMHSLIHAHTYVLWWYGEERAEGNAYIMYCAWKDTYMHIHTYIITNKRRSQGGTYMCVNTCIQYTCTHAFLNTRTYITYTQQTQAYVSNPPAFFQDSKWVSNARSDTGPVAPRAEIPEMTNKHFVRDYLCNEFDDFFMDNRLENLFLGKVRVCDLECMCLLVYERFCVCVSVFVCVITSCSQWSDLNYIYTRTTHIVARCREPGMKEFSRERCTPTHPPTHTQKQVTFTALKSSERYLSLMDIYI